MDIPITANVSDSINAVSLNLPLNPNSNNIDDQSLDNESDDTSSENYEVEAILEMRIKKGIKEYKIKWKDYPIDSCTWEVFYYVLLYIYILNLISHNYNQFFYAFLFCIFPRLPFTY